MSPISYDPIPPPGRLRPLHELRLPVDVLTWMPTWLTTRTRPAAEPRSVLLLPGFGTGPRATRIVGRFLARRGHHVSDWGLGVNSGEARKLRVALEPVVASRVERAGEPIVMVGWSLGGFIAREYAREHPHQIRRVVTLGSPVIGGPRYTATAARYRAQGHDLDVLEQAVRSRYATPLRVPVSAVYSKRDGIVAWRACIDRWSPDVEHIEVDETHLGLVLSPRVLAIVAREVERELR
jgi:pimeloyl-ACP methyl ester carboxylesterase